MGLLVDNNNKGNNFHVKIILMVILSLCWKPQHVPLLIMGLLPNPVQQQAGRSQKCTWQTHPDIWESLEPAQHKPSLPDESTAPISQENQPSGVVSRGNTVATSRDGRRWHHWISRWQAKQHQCAISSTPKKNQNHLRSYRREKCS